MAVKTFSKPATVAKATPAKNGNGKAIQRKILPGLFTTAMVQRKERSGSWVHQGVQKPVQRRAIIQPKAIVHPANDRFEKEADHVADKVVSNEPVAGPVGISRVKITTQRKCASCDKEEVQAMHIQRKCSSCEERESVQRKVTGTDNHSVASLNSTDTSPPLPAKNTNEHSLDTVLGQSGIRGSPLPLKTRMHMEGRMGADFSGIRIHTDKASQDANGSIGARAFTHGSNIHFAGGEFNPETKAGKHLLAHELAHTMQQGAAPSKPVEPGMPVQRFRKVVPKPQFEKKVGRIPSPYENKEESRKEANTAFTKRFKGKKAPKLPAALLKKSKQKKLRKEAIALPKKENKQKGKVLKPVAKPGNLVNAKGQHDQINRLATSGISFKPNPDKTASNDPVQKVQSLQSKRLSEQVLVKAAHSSALITSSIARVRPTLTASSANAIAMIKTNELAQKETIRSAIQLQKATIKKSMQQAAGSISAYHAKVITEIKAAAAIAKAEVLQAKVMNLMFMEVAAAAQLPKIDATYQHAKKEYENTGSRVGNQCYSSQSQRGWNEFLSKMKHEDDSLLDGPYSDDKKEARGNAAIKVGEGYKEGLIKAGAEQAGKIEAGKPQDYEKVFSAKAAMQEYLNALYSDSLKGIEAAERGGVTQADSTKKSMLNSVYSQHKAGQAKLDTTEKIQFQLTEILAVKQSQQVELQAAQAIENMEEGGAQSLSHLNNGFKEYKQICESMNSPPPALLQQQLQPIENQLSQTAPSMAASLQRGIVQVEAGINKTAADTIATTNTTIAAGLAESKSTNEQAIDGLKKLQGAAINALQGILTNNKKTITTTASQCVSTIQLIKTSLDDALTKIGTDLASSLKAAAEQFQKALQDAVSRGTAPENKSMLTVSIEKENEAEAKVEPRWKSALKILLVVVVILVIALVVGPAVIGFIGAAAGGGAFGAAVGAVVGGAILGAVSSGVITVGNNLIDGKAWHKGVGHAMLEGAITGAIGGAFGAAGSGIAGKIIGQAAKGVGPALGRFAIQQTVDFGGNIATEFVSSKIQGKEFSWTSVAQGQAIGVGMHVGMGGLGALKDVKGFKTINAISEGAGKFGEAAGNKIRGKPAVVEPPVAAVKTDTELPRNKGPAVEEPGGAGKMAEGSKTSPKEDPVGTTSKQESPAGSKPVEEPRALPKEEPAPVKATEEPGSTKTVAEEKKPSNLSREEIDDGIAAKHPTEDGHHMKVTRDGKLVKCSTCQSVDFDTHPHKKDLPESKLKKFEKEWEDIQKIGDVDAKAKAGADFDARLNTELDKHLSDGAKIARAKGMPPAEDGYHWKDNGTDTPTYSKDPLSGKPEMIYNKQTNQIEPRPTGGSKDWQAHETKVDAELRAKNPGVDIRKQGGIEVTLSDGSKVVIHPDNIVKQPDGTFKIIDAKHQMDGLIASGQKQKGPFTENQSKAYPEIAQGKATAIAAYDMPEIGVRKGDPIPLSKDIRIHTNDAKGNIVDLPY